MKILNRILSFAVLLLFISNYGYMQSDNTQKYTPLQIGDKVPDVKLTNMVNYPGGTAKISDFHGKVLILDYWFSGCRPCIASWPKLLTLQEKFKDKVQFLLVNPIEEKTTVENFIATRKKYTEVDMVLPSACKDVGPLLKLLPVSSYPQMVLIDSKGDLRKISNTINSENIELYLNDSLK